MGAFFSRRRRRRRHEVRRLRANAARVLEDGSDSDDMSSSDSGSYTSRTDSSEEDVEAHHSNKSSSGKREKKKYKGQPAQQHQRGVIRVVNAENELLQHQEDVQRLRSPNKKGAVGSALHPKGPKRRVISSHDQKSSWRCQQCTYENAPDVLICIMCGCYDVRLATVPGTVRITNVSEAANAEDKATAYALATSMGESTSMYSRVDVDDGYFDSEERLLYEKALPRPKQLGIKDNTDWKKGDMLGAGSFGRVWLGLNQGTGELMAVKQVPVDSQSADLNALQQEIALLSLLNHRNVVRYLGCDVDEDNAFLNIFLEYVPGGSIASLLKRFGHFKENLARTYIKQVLSGLKYLHQYQIVHRDVKGANILVDNLGVCKLADFGASATLADMSNNGIQALHGTPYWMAPEVVQQLGHGRQADIWSIGCTVIEMTTGHPPWSQYASHVSALFHIAMTKELPTFPNHMSDEGREFLTMCLQRDPFDRPNAVRLLRHAYITRKTLTHDTSKALSISQPPTPAAEGVSQVAGKLRSSSHRPARLSPKNQGVMDVTHLLHHGNDDSDSEDDALLGSNTARSLAVSSMRSVGSSVGGGSLGGGVTTGDNSNSSHHVSSSPSHSPAARSRKPSALRLSSLGSNTDSMSSPYPDDVPNGGITTASPSPQHLSTGSSKGRKGPKSFTFIMKSQAPALSPVPSVGSAYRDDSEIVASTSDLVYPNSVVQAIKASHVKNQDVLLSLSAPTEDSKSAQAHRKAKAEFLNGVSSSSSKHATATATATYGNGGAQPKSAQVTASVRPNQTNNASSAQAKEAQAKEEEGEEEEMRVFDGTLTPHQKELQLRLRDRQENFMRSLSASSSSSQGSPSHRANGVGEEKEKEKSNTDSPPKMGRPTSLGARVGRPPALKVASSGSRLPGYAISKSAANVVSSSRMQNIYASALNDKPTSSADLAALEGRVTSYNKTHGEVERQRKLALERQKSQVEFQDALEKQKQRRGREPDQIRIPRTPEEFTMTVRKPQRSNPSSKSTGPVRDSSGPIFEEHQ